MPDIFGPIIDFITKGSRKLVRPFISMGKTKKIIILFILLLIGIFLFITKDKTPDPNKKDIYNKILTWRHNDKYLGYKYMAGVFLFLILSFYLHTAKGRQDLGYSAELDSDFHKVSP